MTMGIVTSSHFEGEQSGVDLQKLRNEFCICG
jgi:hypothetical protein